MPNTQNIRKHQKRKGLKSTVPSEHIWEKKQCMQGYRMPSRPNSSEFYAAALIGSSFSAISTSKNVSESWQQIICRRRIGTTFEHIRTRCLVGAFLPSNEDQKTSGWNQFRTLMLVTMTCVLPQQQAASTGQPSFGRPMLPYSFLFFVSLVDAKAQLSLASESCKNSEPIASTKWDCDRQCRSEAKKRLQAQFAVSYLWNPMNLWVCTI